MKKAKVIAFANHKGGVGKTTSVANIGVGLSRKGKRVLLIDLDAQANLTYMLIGKRSEEVSESVYDALAGRCGLPIVEAKGVSLCPASIDLARTDLELSARFSRELLLKRVLEDRLEEFDYILLDCPPALGLITYNALAAASEVYVPLTPEVLPLQGLSTLEEVVGLFRDQLNAGLSVTGIIITRYNKRRINSAVVDNLMEGYGEGVVFSTKIRENISIAEAPLAGEIIYDYAPDSNGARDYGMLVEEMLARGTKEGEGRP